MKGIIMMMIHAVSLSILYVVVKKLTQFMHSDQIGFLYRFTIFIIVVISSIKGGFKKHLSTKRIELHALRGVFSILGSLSMFRALGYIGATDAAALSKLEHSFMVIIGICFFKERISLSKFILLISSIIGAMFIFNFHSIGNNLDWGYFYILLALLFWLINNVVVKKLGRTERSRAQLFYSSLVASVIAFFFAIEGWQSVSFNHLYLILIAALASLLHKLTFFKAYKFTDISIASPFDYTRLVITALFAYIFLGDIPKNSTFIGCAIITIAGVYFISVERKALGLTKKIANNK